MGNNLYDNLLKATNNIDDITTERYATVTKLNGNYCDVKEEDTGLEHTNVPIVNGANLSVGDKAIIGFINNSIYDAVCYGALDKQIHDDSKQDLLISGTNIKTINNTSLLGSGNISIQGGGTVTVDDSLSTTSTNPVQNKVITGALNGKANSSHTHTKSDITDFPTLHTVATSGSYNDLLDKPNIPSGVVVDLNLDGTSNNAVANSAVVGGLNDKIEASDISFGFDADTKEIYIEVK